MTGEHEDRRVRMGIAHHFGWAVAVTTSAEYEVLDRRRIELIEPGVPAAPIHQESKQLDDAATEELVAEVFASAQRATAIALDEIQADVFGEIVSVSLRDWPADFPQEITTQRRSPYEAQADSVMYRKVLAESASERGWAVCYFDAKDVEAKAMSVLGTRAEEVLHGPRATLGPPWNKDHRIALAATIVAVQQRPSATRSSRTRR